MALMSKRWELTLLKLSELERDACIDLAQGNNDNAREKFIKMMDLIRATCGDMQDLYKVLKERGYTAGFPMIQHYAELFHRFTVCVRDQMNMLEGKLG